MSHIHSIEITNFKSIRHQKIDGCKRINVFIGYPNVGKSNVLEALSLFSINESKDDLASFIRVADLTTIFFNGNVSEDAKVNVDDKYQFSVVAEKEELLFKQQFKLHGTVTKKSGDWGHYTWDATGEIEDGRFFRINSKTNRISDAGKVETANKYEPLDIKKYDFKKNISFKEEFLTLSTPNGNNLFRILSSNESIRKEISELFKPYNLELLYDARLQEFSILKRTETGIFTIPYNLIADTLQRVIFFKTAILSNKNTVLLFEEPEAHMFPPYIRKVTADILFDENNNQYFIATHSPDILTEFIEEESSRSDLSVYVVDYANGETIIKRLTEEELIEVAQFGIDLFYNLESYLDRYGQPHSA